MLNGSDHVNIAGKTKSATKAVLAQLLYWSGALSLIMHRRLNQRAIVLMYHRVLPANLYSQSFSHPGIVVTPETFAMHMAFVQQKLRPLSLAQFRQHMESGAPFPDRACLVTFDDGWVDNHDYALPILREFGIPAVVFVATDYIGSDRPFWQEYLGYLLYQVANRSIGESILHSHGILLPSTRNQVVFRAAMAATVNRFRERSYEDIEELIGVLTRLLDSAGCDHRVDGPDQFMTWQQLCTLAVTGIEIASHSVTHRLLTRLDATTVGTEFAMSRAALRKNLGLETCALAYPGGQHDDRTRRLASDAGYRLGFTTRPGTTAVDTDPLMIPRVNIHESSTNTIPLFLTKVLRIL